MENSNEEETQKAGRMLIEFFNLNKISKNIASTAMLGIYMAINQDMGVSYKEMKKRFNKCLEGYKKI